MTDRTISEQALSPSSSEIMRKATRLVDQLLIKTSNDFPNQGGVSLGKWNDTLNSNATMVEDINCGSNSITDSETLSVLTSARKNTPSIDVIKRLAGRLKNKDSDAISELNFPNKIAVTGGQDSGDYCFHKSENCRSKSVSPTSSDNVRENGCGLTNEFAQMNEKLSEINKRVENLSSNIEDIQDSDQLEDDGGHCARNEKGKELRRFDIEGDANPEAYEMGVDDSHLSHLNVAVLQQERLRMWARDNAKYTSSASNTSENGNNQESEHIPFSDVYCTQQSLKFKTVELTSSSGILNSSVLSTTVSGTNGQFAYSNDTTVYDTRSNDRNCAPDLPKKLIPCAAVEYSENKAPVQETQTYAARSSVEPKALRFIRVGSQLRRSITVTPLIESLQGALLGGDVEGADALFGDHNAGSRTQFKSKLEKLSSSNVSTLNSSKPSPGYFANNTVIITVKDTGIESKTPKRKTTLDDTSSVDSSDSDRNNFFSCRECSWNPTNACLVQ